MSKIKGQDQWIFFMNEYFAQFWRKKWLILSEIWSLYSNVSVKKIETTLNCEYPKLQFLGPEEDFWVLRSVTAHEMKEDGPGVMARATRISRHVNSPHFI